MAAATDLVESIIIDKGEQVVEVFVDLTKAFDSVKHLTLIHLHQSLGINGLCLKLFQCFLHNGLKFLIGIEFNKLVKGMNTATNLIK